MYLSQVYVLHLQPKVFLGSQVYIIIHYLKFRLVYYVIRAANLSLIYKLTSGRLAFVYQNQIKIGCEYFNYVTYETKTVLYV